MRPFSLALVLGLLHPAPRAFAQRGAPSASCTEIAVRDTSRVWQEIDAQCAQLANAMRRKDVDALFALYEISRGASFVDGKRVDITKPYIPDAPPYDPSPVASPR